MPLALVMDILVAILLMITIGYAWTLNKRLGHLRRDKGELEKMALNFHNATDRAEQSIAKLNVNVEVLQDSIKKSELLRDDLIFLTDRGAAAADRLEVAVRAARDEAGIGPGPAKPAAPNNKIEDAALPEGIKPQLQKAARNVRPTLKADPSDRAETADSQKISEAERELLKALRSAG